MRQIRFCAWLCVAASAVAACGGGEFTSGEPATGGARSPGAGATFQTPDEAEDGGARGGSRSGGGRPTSGAAPAAGGAGGASTSTGGAAGATISGPKPSPPLAPDEAEDCAVGSVKILMRPSPKLPGGFLCDASCGTGWLTITDAEGATAFSISAACGTASCDTCEVQACGAAACLPTALGSSGSELEWTGTYLAKDTCGDHAACQRRACVKPGKYKARACSALNGGETEYGCQPQGTQLCAEAEFDFPSKEDVVLVLAQ